MNKDLRIGRKFLCLVIALVMVMTLIPRMPASFAYAAAGDTPAHEKKITDNKDGTYTISLDVVGDAEKKPNNVNVIVIVDRSGSMGDSSGNTSVTYTPTDRNNGDLYGLVDGEYVQLTRQGNYWSGYTYWYNGTQYTGQRYRRIQGNQTRLEATQEAVNNLAESLLGYNGTDGNPEDTVEMALVSFANNAVTNVSKTTSSDTFTTAVNNLSANGGTNWEAGLKQAAGVNFGDNDPTYVIFFSDGAPTYYGTRPSGSGYEQEPNMRDSYNAATDDAKALTDKIGVNNFYTIFAYGESYGATYMTNLTEAAGSPAGNNYSASNTAELQEAFAQILEAIEMSGIGNVEIEDGTTNQVTTSSGEIAELLELVPNFKYYRSGGTYGTMQEWTDAPEAEVVNGKVEWDLDEVGVLENGVKYTVTFDVYPSQYTYDTIAKLKNGDITYDSLDPEVKKYIVDNGGGSYSLRTNTDATLSYDDTRTDEKEKPIGYTNPDPVGTDASSLTIKKEWEGADAPNKPLPITVLMDGDEFHTAQLSGPDWETSTFISFGIIKGDTVLTGAEGHDFSFAELDDTQYRWELDAPVVHPMIIDGAPTVLVKVDETHTAPSGAKTYTIDGDTYYVDSAVGGLTATNYRRSNLNLTKIVIGEDAPEDAKFPFTLTVNNSKAPDAEPADDTDHNSDYWVWFSIYDTVAGETVTDAAVTGATGPSADGYYYAPSGSAITVDMQAGWNLRFTNLPSGTTYTFAETMPQGFAFKEAKLTEGEDSTFSGGQTTTGTIETTKTSYYVEYTNDYQLTNLEITKKWEDNSDQDGKRLTEEELAAKLSLSPAVEGAAPTVVDNKDNTYTITYTGLPRYNNNAEVEYTVTEAEIEGYTTEGSPAKDHETITNSHTPEVTDITVTKAWDDGSNQDGNRPDSLTLTLNGAPEGTTVPDPEVTKSGNNWTYTWSGLPKYADGEEIAYTVTEGTVPEGYTCKETTVNAGGTITNSYTPLETTVMVTKAWDDESNQDGKRPETLELTLNGLPEGTTAPTPEISKNGNNWTYTWSGLPKNAGGQPIVYTVTEGTVPAEYTCKETTVEAGGTITNTHTPEVTEAEVEKVWDDNKDQDGMRPQKLVMTLSDGKTVTLSEDNDWTAKITGLPKYANGELIKYTWTEEEVKDYTAEDPVVAGTKTTFTNVHTPILIDIEGEKTWSDDDDRDGYRPEKITVNLLADGEKVDSLEVTPDEDGNWTYAFEDVPKYANGKEIVYTVIEEKVDKYDPTIDGFNVKNTHDSEKVNVSVEKVWDDDDNRDGIRPASVTVTLLANGETATKEIAGTENATVTLSEDNDWSYEWEGLYKNSEGEEIEYTVVETAVEGYTPEIKPAGEAGSEEGEDPAAGDDTVQPADPGDQAEETTEPTEPTQNGEEQEETPATGYIITNVHDPEKIEITVTKTWNDDDDRDGKRPGSITFNLLANGEACKSASVTAEDDWTYTFEDLFKYEKGKEIAYTVTEEKVDDYETTVDGYEVTNKHVPEETTITVTKNWDDANNRDGIRPENVTVTLLANGESADVEDAVATLNKDNEWTYTWEGLYKYEEGKEIAYTVEETAVDGYEAIITGDAANGYQVKNYHLAKPEPIMIDPPVKKVVNGTPKTNETFTFQMKAVTEGAPMPEGAKDGIMTMQITGSGEKEFGEAWISEAGKYVYEITEVKGSAEGYTYDSTVYTLTVDVKEVADGTQVKLVKTETVTGGNGTIVFTNEYKEPAAPTGDTTIVVPYVVIGISALILLIMLLFRTRKNRA